MKCFGKYLSAIMVVFAVSVSANDNSEVNADQQLKYVPNEVLVKFKASDNQARASRFNSDMQIEHTESGFSYVRREPSNLRMARSNNSVDETQLLLEEVLARDDVEWAHLNYYMEFSSTPNDPLYPYQWNLQAINVPAAWTMTQGVSAVRIAVVDSGHSVRAHPDLNWFLKYNADTKSTTNAHHSGGWDHGTHVGGIIGASRNNLLGVSGICPHCSLLSVKTTHATGDQPVLDNVIEGINWSVKNNAKVINLSLQMDGNCANYPGLQEAIDTAVKNDVLVVVAAGNKLPVGWNVDLISPASCVGAVAVAATQKSGDITSYSGRGAGIDISAPGGEDQLSTTVYYGSIVNHGGQSCPGSLNIINDEDNILSTWSKRRSSFVTPRDNCYRYLGGTSMSAAHVSGVAGLMFSRNQALRNEQALEIIKNTATAIPSCGADCGAGLLNAYNAVHQAPSTRTGPCSANPSAAHCKISSLSQYTNSSNVVTEKVIAYGKLWEFNGSGQQVGYTKDLRAFKHLKEGPCSNVNPQDKCNFDSHVVVDYPGLGYVESITAYGRVWNFDANGVGWAGNGDLVSSIPRFAAGPCSYAPSSSNCQFEARVLVDIPGQGLVEGINAYGRYFVFNAAGTLVESGTNKSVPRFAAGPCAYQPAGSALCNFDSRELRYLANGDSIETVTAYGRFFEWRNGNPTVNSGKLLTTNARMR